MPPVFFQTILVYFLHYLIILHTFACPITYLCIFLVDISKPKISVAKNMIDMMGKLLACLVI